MMNMKKMLALLLAVVMILGMLPFGAMAEENEPSVPETTETVVETTGAAALVDLEPCDICGSDGCTATHVECVTCGAWDCKTQHDTQPTPPATEPKVTEPKETEPKETEPKVTEPKATEPKETEPKVTEPKETEPGTPVEKCGICGGEHKADACTTCPICKVDPCTCVKCDECGVKNDHTSTCTKKPCEVCGKAPCECATEPTETTEATEETTEPVEICEYCGVELTEDAEHEEDCLTFCTCEPVEGVHQEGCIFYEEEEIVEEDDQIEFEEQDASVSQVVISSGNGTSLFRFMRGGSGITSSVASGAEVYALSGVPATNSRYITNWSGLYHIESDSAGIVTMSNLPGIEDRIVEVRHYFDDADAVSAAIASGNAKFYTEEGISKYLPDETAAVMAVDPSRVDTVCYEIFTTENETVIINGEDSISFAADSYSLFEVGITYVPPVSFTTAAPYQTSDSINIEGIQTSKSVVYDEESNNYTLVLESYVTGSTTTTTVSSTKATDFVIALDTSYSMYDCVNCGKVGIENRSNLNPSGDYTSCNVFAKDLTLTGTYYKDTKGKQVLTYCSDCEGWFLATHTQDGKHGSTSDVRYQPKTSLSDTTPAVDGGTIQFYEDHVCDSTCADPCELAGTRAPVFVTDADFSTDKIYYIHATSNTASYTCKYCIFENVWRSGTHSQCDGGSVRKPKSSADDKTSGTITFYEDHICTSECPEDCTLKGTRAAVYTSDPGFSTEKTYFRDSTTSHTSETYVCKYCDLCNAWNSGAHKQKCSGGTVRAPFEHATYDQTQYVQFHIPCVSLMRGAKNAIEAFIDEVHAKSKGPDGIGGTADDVKHRVALVGFSGDPENESGGQMKIDYRPVKGDWTRSGIFSVWNSDVEEAKKWYPNIGDDFTGSIEQQNFVSYWNIDSSTNDTELARAEYFYKHALRDVTSDVEMQVLEEGMEDYAYEYGTLTQHGVIMADKIFQNNLDPDRNRVMVLFTDGEPASANTALAAVNNIKNNDKYTATIYGIGTFSQASAQDILPLPSLSTNKFLTLMSSNYLSNSTTTKNAAGKSYSVDDVNPILWLKDEDGNYVTNSDGDRVFNVWRTDGNNEYILDENGLKIPRTDKGAYYLSADNGEDLVKAFQSVANTSTVGGAEITLNSETVVQDVMSAEWAIDNVDSNRGIEAYTMTYIGNVEGTKTKQWQRQSTGELIGRLPAEEGGEASALTITTAPVTVKETVIENGVGVEKDVQRDAVQVKGFDYSANYVGIDKSTSGTDTVEKPHGKKLVVEIPVKPASGNKGGKAQLTNNSEKSGLIVDGKILETFESPAIDLPVNVPFKKVLQNGDLTQSFTFDMSWKNFDGYSDTDNVPGNGNYLKAKEKDGGNEAFTTTSGMVTDITNLVSGTEMTITEKIDFNFMVEVSLDGGKTFLTAPQNSGFVTNAVVEEDEDDSATEPPAEESLAEDGNTDDVTPDDENEEGGNPDGTDGENGTVEGGDDPDVDKEPEYTLKLIRNDDGTVTAEVTISEETDIVFRNTLLITDLTITKTLTSAAKENQAFLFHMQGNDENNESYVADVIIVVPEGETVGTATIKDVLIGEYTVAEDQNWAWRYELSEGTSAALTQNVTINAEDNNFAFTNVRKIPYWLSGDCYAENNWGTTAGLKVS